MTIARAQHHSVIAKRDWAAVAVDRGVPHVENSHWRILDRSGLLRESSIDRIAMACYFEINLRTGKSDGAFVLPRCCIFQVISKSFVPSAVPMAASPSGHVEQVGKRPSAWPGPDLAEANGGFRLPGFWVCCSGLAGLAGFGASLAPC
jgi:hypothetical protein